MLFGWWKWFNFLQIFRNLSSCLAICHLCLIFRELIRMSNWSCFTLNMSCHDVMFCHEMWKCSNSSCHNSPDNINCKFVLLRWLISGAKVLTTTWLQFPTLCQLEISLRYSTFHTQKIFQIYFYICVVLKFDMTGIWGDVCEVWHDMWDLMWRCDGSQMRGGWYSQILANTHITTSHIRKLLTLLHKYITHIKYHVDKIFRI